MVGKYIHDSELVNNEFDCHYVNLTTATSLEDIGKGGVGKLWAFAKKLWEIRKAIRKEKPEMVYITPNTAGGPFYKDFVVVEWCKWWSAGKVILHFHNKGVQTRQDRWLDNKLYHRFFKNVEVILLGKPLYEDIRKYVQEEHVHYCANGIANTLSRTKRPSAYETLTLRNGRCPTRRPEAYDSSGYLLPSLQGGAGESLLFLSNLLITKGVLELLDALVLLKERGYRFVCDFVGGETAEMDGQRFQMEVEKRQLKDWAIYHGRKYGEEKETYYGRADIFVLPSYTEAFPLTVLEAMEHAVPVVATNVGGMSIAVENGVTGLLVGEEKPVMTLSYRPDASQLAEKLSLLLSDEALRRRMGQAGRKKFLQEFTLEHFEKQFVKVLKAALQNE